MEIHIKEEEEEEARGDFGVTTTGLNATRGHPSGERAGAPRRRGEEMEIHIKEEEEEEARGDFGVATTGLNATRGHPSDCSRAVIGACIEVHRHLGPGLLESTYEACLVHELTLRGLRCQSQVSVPLLYKDARLDCGYRLDLLVEDAVLVEIKAVDQLIPIHQAQVVTYLKLSGIQVGLLVNFNARRIVEGLRRLTRTD